MRVGIRGNGLAALAVCTALILAFLSGGVAYASETYWQNEGIDADQIASERLDVVPSAVGDLQSTPAATGDDPLALSLFSARTAFSSVPIPVNGYYLQSQARSMLAMVNDLRLQVGAVPLEWDVDLESTAMQRAMETTLLFSHTRPSGESCFEAFPDWAVSGGENIAVGYMSASSAFEGWRNSSGHYSNMVNQNFTTVGIACVVSQFDGSYYWVQCFSNGSGSGVVTETFDGEGQCAVYIEDSLVSSVSYDSSARYLGVGSLSDLPGMTVELSGTSDFGYSITGQITYGKGFFYWEVGDAEVASFVDDGYLCGNQPGSTWCSASMPSTSKLNFTFDVKVVPMTRLAGLDALSTMQQIVRTGFDNDSCDTVIVATMGGYWDALSASALAGLFDCPVLLTDGETLSVQASEEIERLGATRVYIAGGTAAVSEEVASQIASLPNFPEVRRLAGDIAIETALQIYREGYGEWGDTAIIAASGTFQDALSASPYAYWANAPIFLANAMTHELDENVLNELKSGGFKRVVIAGGPAAISESVESQLGGLQVIRLYGDTCFETSGAIASWCIDEGMNASHVGVATGFDYYDALTGAALCGSNASPLILAHDGWTGAIDAFIPAHSSEISLGYVFGGPSAISEPLFAYLGRSLGY